MSKPPEKWLRTAVFCAGLAVVLAFAFRVVHPAKLSAGTGLGRKVVQIAASQWAEYALADDGTVWKNGANGRWELMPRIPQPGEPVQ